MRQVIGRAVSKVSASLSAIEEAKLKNSLLVESRCD
jgi:hypothetical protein